MTQDAEQSGTKDGMLGATAAVAPILKVEDGIEMIELNEPSVGGVVQLLLVKRNGVGLEYGQGLDAHHDKSDPKCQRWRTKGWKF